jgi:Immunity protein 8
MIAAKVKGIYSLSVDDLEHYSPMDTADFCVPVRVIAGPSDGEGEESFDLQVCSPKQIAKLCEQNGFLVGRHYLIVCKYDFAKIRDIITRIVQSATGSSWREAAEKIARFAHWEFESYRAEDKPGGRSV